MTAWSNGCSGKLLPVYPAAVARHAPTIPKPAWKG